MRTRYLLAIFCFAAACSNGEGSTRNKPTDPQFKLSGIWRQNESFRNSMLDSVSIETWKFDPENVTIGGYTHHYFLMTDSLVISGEFFTLRYFTDDSMLMQNMSTNERIKLMKIKEYE